MPVQSCRPSVRPVEMEGPWRVELLGLVTPTHPLMGAPAWLGFSSHLIPPACWAVLAPGLHRDTHQQQTNLESPLALVLGWAGLWGGQVCSGCGVSQSHPHTLSVCPARSLASAPLPTHFQLRLKAAGHWFSVGTASGRVFPPQSQSKGKSAEVFIDHQETIRPWDGSFAHPLEVMSFISVSVINSDVTFLYDHFLLRFGNKSREKGAFNFQVINTAEAEEKY